MFWGFISALMTSGVTLYVLGSKKKAEIDAYIKGLEASAKAGRGTTAQEQRVVKMGKDLTKYATDYTTSLATSVGNHMISDTYGLTTARIAQLQALSRRFEA